jgi:hypothetical protein
VDEDACRLWEDVDGVPSSLLHAAVVPTTAAEAARLEAEFVTHRSQYAPARDSEVAARESAGAVVDPDDGAVVSASEYECDVAPSGGMVDCLVDRAVLDLHHLGEIVEPDDGRSGSSSDDCGGSVVCESSDEEAGVAAHAAGLSCERRQHVAERLACGARLVVPRFAAGGGVPASDYDKDWFLKACPSAFPNATGFRPAGMSEAVWSQVIINRFPRELMADTLLFALFDVQQRHSAITQASVHLRACPAAAREIGGLSACEHRDVLVALRDGGGRVASSAFAKLSKAQRHLVCAYKVSGSRILGSPASFASARGKAASLWVAVGAYTAFFTYNPSELHCEFASAHAGAPYGFDERGRPDVARPNLWKRWKVMAQNHVACARFMVEFIDVLTDVGFGFRPGAPPSSTPGLS